MRTAKPEFLKSGELARLIPVTADSNRERRAASVLLAAMTAIPEFADRLLDTAGRSVGKNASVTCWTEIVFANQPEVKLDRPDGLIAVRVGRREWKALVEAKIGNHQVSHDQLEKYGELALANDIDAVITITNEFVARNDQHPLKLPRRITNKVGIFHWSWMWVLTQAMLLDMDRMIDDPERAFLLSELIRFLSHDSTGVESFGSMNSEWKDLVAAVRNGAPISRHSTEVIASTKSWHQEEADLCLIMSRHLGRPVGLKVERKFKDHPDERLKSDCQRLVDEQQLVSTLEVPDAAADITVCADVEKRTVTCSMELEAPQDKKSTSARTNWLLRQISKSDDPDLYIRAKWPGSAPDTIKPVSVLTDNPDAIQGTNEKLVPRAFDIVMVKDLAGKFSGRRTFIEHLEQIVPHFYDEVGQHIQAWHPSPPKPIKQPIESKDTDNIKHQSQMNSGWREIVEARYSPLSFHNFDKGQSE